MDDDPQVSDDTRPDALRIARFPSRLQLPAANVELLQDAARAIRQEFRDCSKWKRLRSRKVSLFAERDRGMVYVLHVGGSIEFDWTWEGAVAFRPASLDVDPQFSNRDSEDARSGDTIEWSGEVLEVDERNGCLFVNLHHPEALPTTGSFFVRPFEFLSLLDALYNEPAFEPLRDTLPARLAATTGGIHPHVEPSNNAALSYLAQWWQHTWSVLWGPPGTGKTWTTGRQVAAALQDPSERILVVSTTNRATDAVAISIGQAARDQAAQELDDGRVVRIGNGAGLPSFAEHRLEPMLQGTESETLRQIDSLVGQLPLFDTWEEKALTRKQIAELRAGSGDRSRELFLDPNTRVVIGTAFKAMTMLRDDLVQQIIRQGEAPFTTIFIDEAGLISRTAIAALSLLAARRVVLVGDSKQLAPISRASRLLPPRQKNWLSSSGLSHLSNPGETPQAVHVLREQRRMHPEICRVVSDYQYGGWLKTAPETEQRPSELAPLFRDFSRAIWYVLDDEPVDLDLIRAERGPGNKSWMRAITPHILQRLFSNPEMKTSNGLFLSPFRAQTDLISKWITRNRLTSWQASTVHSQQGSESDIVVFDTVNAGSANWPIEEWKRLVNVAVSRAREAVILLASRSEMDEPYLKPLLKRLTPSILTEERGQVQWQKVAVVTAQTDRQSGLRTDASEAKSGSLGEQISQRRAMKPVLSREQQRLTNLGLDGKPRLVRGVVGSGKSIVLCHWLAKTVRRYETQKDTRIWAVYANRSLHRLLRESVEAAWNEIQQSELFERKAFPWELVSLYHVRDVFKGILPEASLSMDDFEFDYDRAAEEFLNRHDVDKIVPRCTALFIDEAQDMGPSTIKLLLSMVEKADDADPNSRAAHIFYDNAQNIYQRKTPKWSELGIDVRGRSTIMRESFRSTTPITELAVNVLYRLTPDSQHHDQHELMSMGLIEKTEREDGQWLRVRFNQTDGPKPTCQIFPQRAAEIDALARHLRYLIQIEHIAPTDICILYNSQPIAQRIESELAPVLREIGVELSVQTSRAYERRDNTLIVTTANSYKGYEAEVVVIVGVDQFVTSDEQILASKLYVAMTRARSLLAIYGTTARTPAAEKLCQVLLQCVENLQSPTHVDRSNSVQDDLNDLLQLIGHQHRAWLIDLWKRFEVQQEPIVDADGAVIAEPVFWFVDQERIVACFGEDDPLETVLAAQNIHRILPGTRFMESFDKSKHSKDLPP